MLGAQPSSLTQSHVATGDVKLFTLQNANGTKLIASNYGAAVVSLFLKDRAGNFSDVVLGYDDTADYVADEYYIGTVVGRYANRIAGEKVLINGKAYTLSTKEGGYHHHGGKLGFNKKIFSATEFHHANKSGVRFKYKSAHLEEGFPGDLDFEIIYTLDDDDVWSIEYKAVSNRTTLVNFTQHSYFNLSGNLSKSVLNHHLKILSESYLPVNAMQVPEGKIASVKNSVFDFTKFKHIGRDINKEDEQLELSNGYDHSFILEVEHSGDLKHAAVVKENTSGRRMDVYTTEPAIHLYSGNFLENITGKKGCIYNKHSGFCLETQHFPDAPNHPHFPSTVLHADEPFYSKTVFRFGVDDFVV